MNRKVYVLSGLGVDESVFANIDCHPFVLHFIPWMIPNKNEQLAHYVKRLAASIYESNPTIIGLSFGGIIAVEMAKLFPEAYIIQIASVKTHLELPLIYRWIGLLKLHRLVPKCFLKYPNFLTYRMFGIEHKKEKALLNAIFARTNPEFRNWAIDVLLNWRNREIPSRLIAIHGTKDRLIPIRNVKVDFPIEGAGHFLTVNKSKTLSELLKHLLSKWNKD
jgi:pimeloyl-ACP methyl ester carboxylesterase